MRQGTVCRLSELTRNILIYSAFVVETLNLEAPLFIYTRIDNTWNPQLKENTVSFKSLQLTLFIKKIHMQTKSLISLVVLLALFSLSQGYVFPDDQCCCSSRTWDTNSTNLNPDRYTYPSTNMTVLFKIFLTYAHDINYVTIFLNHLEGSLRTQIWNQIRNQMAVEYSMKDVFGEPRLGAHLLNFCTKSRYGEVNSEGRFLQGVTPALVSSQPGTPPTPPVVPPRQFFPYPYLGSIKIFPYQNDQVQDVTEMILALRDGSNSAIENNNFIYLEDVYDGSKKMDSWAWEQYFIQNDFFCSVGYGQYIRKSFDKAAENDYSNSDDLLSVLMTISFPQRWERKLFVKWTARILRALHSEETNIDNLVCIKKNYPQPVKDRWSQSKECSNNECYSNCNSQC